MSLFYTESAQENKPEILIVFLLFCGVTLVIWWRKYITQSYLTRVRNRNMQTLEQQALFLGEENEALRAHNERLGALIHRDNKIIPAMVLAVESVVQNHATNDAQALLENLRALSADRAQATNDYQRKLVALPTTGDTFLDGVLLFLQNKAFRLGVTFAYEQNGGVGELDVERIDLNTLLCDLGENALIATKNGGSVFLRLDFTQKKLTVYDDAPYFDKAVLAQLFKKKASTHLHEGGSGTGLITTFDLLKKYSASFTLNEHEETPFTKSVEIAFDGLFVHTLHPHDEEKRALVIK